MRLGWTSSPYVRVDVALRNHRHRHLMHVVGLKKLTFANHILTRTGMCVVKPRTALILCFPFPLASRISVHTHFMLTALTSAPHYNLNSVNSHLPCLSSFSLSAITLDPLSSFCPTRTAPRTTPSPASLSPDGVPDAYLHHTFNHSFTDRQSSFNASSCRDGTYHLTPKTLRGPCSAPTGDREFT